MSLANFIHQPLFKLGQLAVTRGAIDALGDKKTGHKTAIFMEYIVRHARGDWGDLDAHDKADNDYAVKHGDRRILSAYTLQDDQKIWIITEADRSVTTVLLPEEY